MLLLQDNSHQGILTVVSFNALAKWLQGVDIVGKYADNTAVSLLYLIFFSVFLNLETFSNNMSKLMN